MEWVVTTGRTVEEAKDAALDELGVDEHDAEFEILEEPRQGLFGRQRGEARVRARVRPSVPRPKTDRRDRRRRKPEGTNARSPGEVDAASPDDAPPEPPPARRSRAKTPTRDVGDPIADPRPASTDAGSPAVDGAADGDASTQAPRRRRRGGAKAASSATASRPARRVSTAAVADAAEDDDDDEAEGSASGGTDMGEQELDLAQQGEVAEAFVQGLLGRFELSAETTITTLDEDTLEVAVTGTDLGLLIGPKGQTLQAVQEVTRTVVQRRASNRVGRILVDVAGYRVRRREALERFTRQVADDVRASGVQRVLEPMSAADRKIVHDAANELDGVRTISEGEEPRRRVVILPEGSGAEGSPAAGSVGAADSDGADSDDAGAADTSSADAG
jgi:spoIIIJ-associated protein